MLDSTSIGCYIIKYMKHSKEFYARREAEAHQDVRLWQEERRLVYAYYAVAMALIITAIGITLWMLFNLQLFRNNEQLDIVFFGLVGSIFSVVGCALSLRAKAMPLLGLA
jgi:hypothetical protein